MSTIRLNKVAVTGAAGFIGSSTVDWLLNQGTEVLGIDNFSTGRLEVLQSALSNPKFKLIEEDIFSSSRLSEIFFEVDAVFRLEFTNYLP